MAVFIKTPGFFQASEWIVVLALDRDRRHHPFGVTANKTRL
jgi:hypothetical protein